MVTQRLNSQRNITLQSSAGPVFFGRLNQSLARLGSERTLKSVEYIELMSDINVRTGNKLVAEHYEIRLCQSVSYLSQSISARNLEG
jgi:hypothetical protein